MATRERDALNSMSSPKEPPAGAERDTNERESSKAPDSPREATPEPPCAPADAGGKERRRSPLSVMEPMSKVKVEVTSPSREATSTVAKELPPREPSVPAAAAVSSSNNSSPRKRRFDESEIAPIKKEPLDDSRPSTPLDDGYPSPEYAIEDEYDEDEEEEEDDQYEITPKKQRTSSDINLYAIPFHRSLIPSSSPAPQRFRHPEFPERAALRCPNYRSNHRTIESRTSMTNYNYGRVYYRCGDCSSYPNFICWADSEGVCAGNPICRCGYPSREGLATDASSRPDTLFYGCAINTCSFYEWGDRLSPAEANAYCGREVHQL